VGFTWSCYLWSILVGNHEILALEEISGNTDYDKLDCDKLATIVAVSSNKSLSIPRIHLMQ
jgi:hypothetical protein